MHITSSHLDNDNIWSFNCQLTQIVLGGKKHPSMSVLSVLYVCMQCSQNCIRLGYVCMYECMYSGRGKEKKK